MCHGRSGLTAFRRNVTLDPNCTWQVLEASPTILSVTPRTPVSAVDGPARLVYDPITTGPVLFGASDGVDVAPFDLVLPF